MITTVDRNLLDDYLSRGWKLVLLKEGSKAPSDAGWTGTTGATLTDALAHLGESLKLLSCQRRCRR